jgi:hypothetical protein
MDNGGGLFFCNLVVVCWICLEISVTRSQKKPEETAICAARQEASEKGCLVLLTAPGANGLTPGAGS